MNFKLYQINLTRDEINNFNNGMPSARVEAKRSMYALFDNFDLVSEVADMLRQGMYDYVADIVDASDLEDAFYLGQGGREPAERLNHIKMHASKMSSVSMGDILEDESGELFVVAQWGFNSLTSRMNKAA